MIAQAEVKSILKSSGSNYKKLRADSGDDAKHYGEKVKFSTKNKNK